MFYYKKCPLFKSVTWHGDTFGKYIQGCVLGFLYILQVHLHLRCLEYRQRLHVNRIQYPNDHNTICFIIRHCAELIISPVRLVRHVLFFVFVLFISINLLILFGWILKLQVFFILSSCVLLVDFFYVFYLCLDSHSNDTNSLQRIHWWERWYNDTFIKICSDEETNSSIFWMVWGWVHFWHFFFGELLKG